MKRGLIALVLIPGLLAGIALLRASRRAGPGPAGPAAVVERGPLLVWAVYEGRVESRDVQGVVSSFDGAAVVTGLVPEGQAVNEGTVLATLDASAIETELLELESDRALAQAELESLELAKHPLQERALTLKLAEARAQLADEEAFLADSRELVEEGLVSSYEIRQQEARLDQAGLQVESLEMELSLTTGVVQRTELQRTRARLASAEQRLEIARRQLRNATIRSPRAGQAVYLPLHVGGEYRTVRVGDTVYKNQPFMNILDMSDPVARCEVPEAELARIRVGGEARVVPLAFADLALAGVVEHIGSAARTRVGQPHWKKYFELVIRLDEADPRLRSDMTVHCHVLSQHVPDALRVPRAAVWWEGDTAFCEVLEGRRARSRPIEIGAADPTHYEVRAGLREGERVKLP